MADSSVVQNEDGSYTITTDGKAAKLVKASDLMGLKEKSEKQLAELQTKLAEANRVKDETHQEALQERAAKEQLESKVQESATLTEKVAELEQRSQAAEERSKQLESEANDNRISHLASLTGKPVETFKDKTPEQLKSVEDALQLVGFENKKPARFDGAGGGGTGGESPVGRDKEKEELALARELRKKSPGDSDHLW